MQSKVILIVGPLLLAACTISSNYDEAIARSTPPGAALRTEIVAGAKELVYDPASIRNAEISNVASLPDGLQGVCVRADSKDVSGRYLGVHSIGIPIRDGKIAGGKLDPSLCNLPDITWHPFPELERLSES
ncbi:hypothetical protein [Paracoccus sp. J56]|uniref:hypothetical protein n=1 Tax=Paracoccus sp. J56 TaxID=935850 RepID=UPI000A0AC17E|nr:hypothetical protein [Paracoccus sp. J56]SMG51714.1 hypothetical protein SAMN02746000_03252 [Paracoccus sp. J56]